MLLVFKEWAQGKIDESVIRFLQLGKSHGLKKEGKPHFDKLIADYAMFSIAQHLPKNLRGYYT